MTPGSAGALFRRLHPHFPPTVIIGCSGAGFARDGSRIEKLTLRKPVTPVRQVILSSGSNPAPSNSSEPDVESEQPRHPDPVSETPNPGNDQSFSPPDSVATLESAERQEPTNGSEISQHSSTLQEEGFFEPNAENDEISSEVCPDHGESESALPLAPESSSDEATVTGQPGSFEAAANSSELVSVAEADREFSEAAAADNEAMIAAPLAGSFPAVAPETEIATEAETNDEASTDGDSRWLGELASQEEGFFEPNAENDEISSEVCPDHGESESALPLAPESSSDEATVTGQPGSFEAAANSSELVSVAEADREFSEAAAADNEAMIAAPLAGSFPAVAPETEIATAAETNDEALTDGDSRWLGELASLVTPVSPLALESPIGFGLEDAFGSPDAPESPDAHGTADSLESPDALVIDDSRATPSNPTTPESQTSSDEGGDPRPVSPLSESSAPPGHEPAAVEGEDETAATESGSPSPPSDSSGGAMEPSNSRSSSIRLLRMTRLMTERLAEAMNPGLRRVISTQR